MECTARCKAVGQEDACGVGQGGGAPTCLVVEAGVRADLSLHGEAAHLASLLGGYSPKFFRKIAKRHNIDELFADHFPADGADHRDGLPFARLALVLVRPRVRRDVHPIERKRPFAQFLCVSKTQTKRTKPPNQKHPWTKKQRTQATNQVRSWQTCEHEREPACIRVHAAT